MPLIRACVYEKVLTWTLDNPAANALSRALVRELAALLDDLERDPPGALVLTGSGERFFSAGLDLLELYPLGRAEIEELVPRLGSVFQRLFALPVPVVAAVNGHAIAGGAILALVADHRLLARGPHLFGLNEVQVGLPLPQALFEIVRAALNPASRTRVLLEGRNLSVDEALAAGLVDELVEPAELAGRARALAQELAALPRAAYRRMKELLHGEAQARIDRAAAGAAGDPFVDVWFEPETRRAMGAAYERLAAKRRG